MNRRVDRTMRWITRPLTFTVLAAVLGAVIGAVHNGQPGRGAVIGALSHLALVTFCLVVVLMSPTQSARLARDMRRKRANGGRGSR